MGAGQTTVNYGGVVIENCLTKRFEQEAVFDDSGTDLLYYKFTIRVIGWCHGISNISSVNIRPASSGGDAALHHRKFRPVVMEPRLQFEMRLGVTTNLAGQVLLKCDPSTLSGVRGPTGTKGVDLNNGPKGRILSVTSIAGNQLLKVEAEFEICKLECGLNDSGTGNLTNVLNNRWSCVDEINSNFYTTRTFTGRLRLAYADGGGPHQFRDWVVPGLQPGLRRERMSFTASEDGLHLDYVVVDKEVAFSAPAPATDWKVTHTESLGEFGTAGYADINIMLAGDRDVDKRELISLAGNIIENKLTVLRQRADKERDSDIILAFSLTDSFGSNQSNQIDVHCRVRHVEIINAIFAKAIGKIGERIDATVIEDYDRDKSRGGRPNEQVETEAAISIVSAFSSYLQSPCSPFHAIQSSFIDRIARESGDNKDNGLAELEASVVSDLPDEVPDWMGEDHQDHMYNYWKMESKYTDDRTKVQLPVASGPNPSSSPSNDPTSVVVTLANGVAKRVVRLTGERVGRWPVAPTPADYVDSETGIQAIMMEVVSLPSVEERGPDGSEIFRISMDIYYALSRHPRANEKFRVGYNPWDNLGIHTTDPQLTFAGGNA